MQFTSFRDRLESASGFQSKQFRQIEAALPVAYDGFCRLLVSKGYDPENLLQVYRDDGPEAQVAERLVDLDEGLQEWRYRHVKMVERTIGTKAGSGGSSGVGYLQSTLFRSLFPDLWEIRARL